MINKLPHFELKLDVAETQVWFSIKNKNIIDNKEHEWVLPSLSDNVCDVVDEVTDEGSDLVVCDAVGVTLAEDTAASGAPGVMKGSLYVI